MRGLGYMNVISDRDFRFVINQIRVVNYKVSGLGDIIRACPSILNNFNTL